MSFARSSGGAALLHCEARLKELEDLGNLLLDPECRMHHIASIQRSAWAKKNDLGAGSPP